MWPKILFEPAPSTTYHLPLQKNKGFTFRFRFKTMPPKANIEMCRMNRNINIYRNYK